MGRISTILVHIRSKAAGINNRPSGWNHQLARLLAAEGILYTLILTLAHNNNNLFASRLGATSSDLGLIASLPPIVGMLSLIPFAIITDRLQNKKSMVILSAAGLGFLYILVGMTGFMNKGGIPVLIVLLILVNIPMSLYNSSWQAFFSDLVAPENRNLIYTHRTRMNAAVGVVIPLIAGAILTAASGSEKILVHQIYYWLAFPLALGQVYILKKTRGGNCMESGHLQLKDLADTARNLLKNKKFLGFSAVALLVYCGWEMDWSLYFIAQFKFLPLNEAQMSMIAVTGAAGQFLTMNLWSRLIHRKGVRFVFVIGSAGFAFSSVVMILSLMMPPLLRLPFYFVFQTVGGSAFSAFQLSLLQCLLESIPDRNRSVSIAIYSTGILFSNVVMPYLGVYMYNVLGQSLSAMIMTFGIIAALRIFATAAAFYRWYKMRTEIEIYR